ncbi:MAG TPA: nuclear transport factor 2 family protein [Chryseolinea sp.]|nr:nuclear transport factor 2 family protein [Chryseolinea sp.]
MKTKISVLLFLLFLISTTLFAQKQTEQQQVQQVLRLVFEAFSEGSVAKMEQALTADVKILETGEVWTLDTVRSYFARPRPADYKRLNTLDFFQTEVEGKMAFVSYHNTAAIHANGKDRMVKWLESAVLVKQGKSWRVKMLHSTRLQTK